MERSFYARMFRLLFDCPDRQRTEQELNAWIEETQSSAIGLLMDAAQKLLLWKSFILNWYKHPISTSKLEVMNRKIGLLQRQACGYRDEERRKLCILQLRKSAYALTG